MPRGTTLPLPADVLRAMAQPPGTDGGPGARARAAEPDSDAAMDAAMAVPHRERASHAAQRVPREAMRAHVASFLLE